MHDPAGLPLQLVLVSGGDHGTVSGSVYTPRPGFVGQDSVTYRVSNGGAVSEIVRVTVFVVPRPAAPGPAPSTNTLPGAAAAPFLSARVKPALDRKRTTLARLACDQACSFRVRLEGTLRGKKMPFKGKVLKRALAADRVLALGSSSRPSRGASSRRCSSPARSAARTAPPDRSSSRSPSAADLALRPRAHLVCAQ